MKPLTRKEVISSGVNIEPLTREEIALKEYGSGGGSGGSSPVVWVEVVGTEDPGTESWTYSSETTLEEITNYYETGKLVLAYVRESLGKIGNGSIFILSSATNDSISAQAVFHSNCSLLVKSKSIYWNTLVCDRNNNWTITQEEIKVTQ